VQIQIQVCWVLTCPISPQIFFWKSTFSGLLIRSISTNLNKYLDIHCFCDLYLSCFHWKFQIFVPFLACGGPELPGRAPMRTVDQWPGLLYVGKTSSKWTGVCILCRCRGILQENHEFSINHVIGKILLFYVPLGRAAAAELPRPRGTKNLNQTRRVQIFCPL